MADSITLVGMAGHVFSSRPRHELALRDADDPAIILKDMPHLQENFPPTFLSIRCMLNIHHIPGQPLGYSLVNIEIFRDAHQSQITKQSPISTEVRSAMRNFPHLDDC